MFLNQEKPEMDDFERKKTLVLKGKKNQYFMIIFCNGYPCKKVTKYFCIFFCFRAF